MYVQQAQRVEHSIQKAEKAAPHAEQLCQAPRQSHTNALQKPMAPIEKTYGTGYENSPIPLNIQNQGAPIIQPPTATSAQLEPPQPEPPQQRPRRRTAYAGAYNVDDLLEKNTFLAREYTQFGHPEPQAMALLADFEANGASNKRIPNTYNQAR